MILKRKVSLILAIFMLIAFTAGCSSAELGFYNLSREISNLDKYETYGEFDITLENIITQGMLDEQMVSQVKSVLNNYSLAYYAQIDVKASKLAFTYYFKDKNTGDQNEILNIQSDGNNLYVKVSDLFDFIKSFGDQETNQGIDQFFGDTKYITINREEMKELLFEVYGDEVLAEQMAKIYFDLDFIVEENKKFEESFKDLIENVYDEYESGLITNDGNKYILSLTSENAVDVFVSLLNYSIDHIDELGNYLKENMDNMSDYQKQLLAVYNINEENFSEQVDTMIEEVKTNKEDYKQALDFMASSAKSEEVKKAWEDNKIEYSLEKLKDDNYKQDLNIDFNFNDPSTGTNIVKGTLNFTQTIKPIDSVSIYIPTENTITIKEIINKASMLEPQIPEPKTLEPQSLRTLEIDLDNGYYISGSKEGTVNIQLIKGSSYIPLRDAGNLLGVQVNWDNELKQPYLIRQGETYYLDAVVIDGTSYIPSRELEKAYYEVNWDAENNVVIIK